MDCPCGFDCSMMDSSFPRFKGDKCCNRRLCNSYALPWPLPYTSEPGYLIVHFSRVTLDAQAVELKEHGFARGCYLPLPYDHDDIPF